MNPITKTIIAVIISFLDFGPLRSTNLENLPKGVVLVAGNALPQHVTVMGGGIIRNTIVQTHT
jgi:hypothetical protein